jgi:serine/threonine-protein kinase
VTNAEYAVFVEATGYVAPPFWKQPHFDHPMQPVVGVSWFDAVAYCEWLGDGCRLPSEAEWEHAARGGIEGALYPWGNDPRIGYATRRMDGPDRVGQSPPNGYGLYDMCENVHEWCSDWFDADARTRRASRGGAWRHQVKISRCDARSSLPPHLRYSDYGFRIARGFSGNPVGS